MQPDDIAFLNGNYRVFNDMKSGSCIFETDNVFLVKMEVLEDAGFIKLIMELSDIRNISDIIKYTEKVEFFRGSPMAIRVYILGHIWNFTENELLGTTAIMRRIGNPTSKMRINKKNWYRILQCWFDISIDVKELSKIPKSTLGR